MHSARLSSRNIVSIALFLSVFVVIPIFNALAIPSITLIQPNGGECYLPGSTVTISWTGSEYDEVSLTYRTETQAAPPPWSPETAASWNITGSSPITGNSYLWHTPTAIQMGTPYQMWIGAHKGTTRMTVAADQSDAFFSFSTSCPSSSTDTGSTNNLEDTTPPVITSVRVPSETIMSTSAQIRWATDDPSDSRVYYGTTASSLTAVASGDCFGGNLVTSHCVNLMGLSSNSPYYYRVESKNGRNLNSVSVVYDFTTAHTSTSSTTTTTQTPSPIPSSTPAPSAIPNSIATFTPTPTPIQTNTRLIGKVLDPQGHGVASVPVWGRELSTEKYVQTRTTTTGTYEFPVSAGLWEFNISVDTSFAYTYQDGSKNITVQSGETRELNFILSALDAGISGTVVDITGHAIADIQGYVSLSKVNENSTPTSLSTDSARSFGSAIENGMFTIKAPPGTYHLNVYLPPDSKYAVLSNTLVTLNTGIFRPYTLTVRGTTALIIGTIEDIAGIPLRDMKTDHIKVYASRDGGSWYNGTISNSTGTYEIKVPEGIWTVGFWIDQSTGYTAATRDTQVTASSTKSVRHNLVVRKAGSMVKGMVTTEEGIPLQNIWISLYSRSTKSGSGETTFQTSPHVASTSTDTVGMFALSVPLGTYYLSTSSGSGHLSPDEIKVVVTAGETAIQNLVLQKPDITVRGTTRVGEKGVSAFVWAWGETGGHVQTQSNANGFYSLTLSKNTTWHIAASREAEEGFFRAAEIKLDTRALTPLPGDVTLVPIRPPARAVEHTVHTTKPQSVALSDGTRIIVPAHSLATSETAHISVAPTIEVPSLPSSSVVGMSYNIKATTAQGTAITTLRSEITITIPYDTEELKARGLTPETLQLSYFDEVTNSWKSLEKQVIDTANHVVIGTVNHLTIFALIAPADTTPPPSPTTMAIARKGSTITLSWKNPSVDFNHIKIYRSATRRALGSVAYNYLVATSQEDTLGSSPLYYTIRAIDLSGNESKNTTQLSTPATDTTPKNFLALTIRQGSRGKDVKALQEFLITHGFLTGRADSIFGKKTRSALQDFQATYNLTADGIVGIRTRNKINGLVTTE